MIPIGASYLGNHHCLFSVWAPEKKSMLLHITYPGEKRITMIKDQNGYFKAESRTVPPGSHYFFIPDEENEYPDPGSHFQPKGVHGPSEVVDHRSFEWTDTFWHGLPLEDLIFYEVHVGTFTASGTFEAIIPLLNDIASTGINAIELMPVCQFPGNRNWGYDGVYPYAVQNSYGGPEGLKKLVEACHSRSIAVYLDVVYNHMGLEGNYFDKFGPYFTDRYRIPWGRAVNFDGEWSDGVREYFCQNTLHWFENYHIDGLRVDAIHMIYDFGAENFWEYTQRKIHEGELKHGRKFYMIAESDLNSPKVVKPFEVGGLSFDAQWLDDFHHALYVILDKKGIERYEDFGLMEQLVKAYTDGFVHSGEYVKFRKRKHGVSSAGIEGNKFVVFNLNHDQVGNRVKGERLSMLVDFERQKLAAAALILSPYLPLLFMGEEYGEDTPFYYFVSLSDPGLIKAVKEGRKKEFENYKWQTEPPDPQEEKTFLASKIQWSKREKGNYKILLDWHKELISLRKTLNSLQNFNKNDLRMQQMDDKGFLMHRKSKDGLEHLISFFNFSDKNLSFTVPEYSEKWTRVIDSREQKWTPPSQKVDLSLQKLALNLEAGQIITLQNCSVAVYRNEKPDV